MASEALQPRCGCAGDGGRAIGAVAHVLVIDAVPAQFADQVVRWGSTSSSRTSASHPHITVTAIDRHQHQQYRTLYWPAAGRGNDGAGRSGPVSRTVSYKMGSLTGLMGRFGRRSASVLRGGNLLLPGSDLRRCTWRLAAAVRPRRAGRAVAIVVAGARRPVGGRSDSWMKFAAGYTLGTGKVTSVSPVSVFFNAATPYETAHMVLAAYMVTGFLVAVYAAGLPRGRRDRYHRLGFAVPFTIAGIGPAAGDDGGHHRPVHRPQPAGQVRRDGIRPRDHPQRSRMGGRDPHQRPRLLRCRRPVVRLDLGRVLAAHPGHRLGQRAPGAAAAARHAIDRAST